MTVIDTSAIVDFLLGTGVTAAVQELFERERELAAPDLLVFEVLAPSSVLRERAWELRRNLTMADAIFVTLAERLREPLATKDPALAREGTKHTASPVVTLTG